MADEHETLRVLAARAGLNLDDERARILAPTFDGVMQMVRAQTSKPLGATPPALTYQTEWADEPS